MSSEQLNSEQVVQLRNYFNYYINNIKNNELDLTINSNDFISNFAMPILSKNKEITNLN